MVACGSDLLRHWCQAPGCVQDQMMTVWDPTKRDQLSRGILPGGGVGGNSTPLGWTVAHLRDLLSFLELVGVRSLDIWPAAPQ